MNKVCVTLLESVSFIKQMMQILFWFTAKSGEKNEKSGEKMII